MTVSPNNENGDMMKFKTTLLQASTIVVLTTISSQILAANTSTVAAWKPYVGVSAGYSRMSAKNQWEEVGLTQGKNNFNSKGFLTTFHVGVKRTIDSIINVGGELYGSIDSNKSAVQFGTRSEAFKRENVGGLKLNVGYLFDTHSFIYVHAGIEKASFKYTVKFDGAPHTAKKYLWGLPFGIGVEAALNSKWSARLEYIHSVYQKWNIKEITIDTRLGPITTRNKISHTQDSIMVGFNYSL